MDFVFNENAPEFVLGNVEVKPPRQMFKVEKTLFDYIGPGKAKKQEKKKAPKEKKEVKDGNKMMKAHIMQDGQVVTAKIAKKDLYSGIYEVLPRKLTKVKKVIKETRASEGIPPNQRPLCSEYNIREYVDQKITQDLDLCIQELIEKLIFFYKRKKQEKITKKVKKRYVKGFKECLKKCASGDLKCVIMAPNIEKVEGEGGLDELVSNLLALCRLHKVPVVFGLSMRAIGSLFINNAAILAVVGITDFTSAEKLFEKMITISTRNYSEFRGVAYDPSQYFT